MYARYVQSLGGVWTPTITFGGAAVGVTYGTCTGTYKVLDDLVQCWFNLNLTSKGSSVGTAAIGGLPFAQQASTLLLGGASPLYANMTGVVGGLQFRGVSSSTTFNIVNTGPSVAVLTDASFANNSNVEGYLSYLK